MKGDVKHMYVRDYIPTQGMGLTYSYASQKL